jgi:hypothetical protein
MFENSINKYYEEKNQLIENYDPYNEILWSYYQLKVIGEVI